MGWLLPTVTASTMIAHGVGCGQGYMSQWGCGNSWVAGFDAPTFRRPRKVGQPQLWRGKVGPAPGVPSEVVLNEEDGMKSPCAVNLHNAVTVSQRRLGKRVAQLSSARMNEVCAALRFSLGCNAG